MSEPRYIGTPEGTLAEVLHHLHPGKAGWGWWDGQRIVSGFSPNLAAAILAALPEPHRQAWADGLALARLRETFPADWAKVAVDLTFEPGHVALAVWPLGNHPRSGVPMRRARTLAEAADAVREALAR